VQIGEANDRQPICNLKSAFCNSRMNTVIACGGTANDSKDMKHFRFQISECRLAKPTIGSQSAIYNLHSAIPA
jgi:hypothetical protein